MVERPVAGSNPYRVEFGIFFGAQRSRVRANPPTPTRVACSGSAHSGSLAVRTRHTAPGGGGAAAAGDDTRGSGILLLLHPGVPQRPRRRISIS